MLNSKLLNDNEDCVCLGDDFRIKEVEFQCKFDCWEVVVRKVKLFIVKIVEIVEQEFMVFVMRMIKVKVVDFKDVDDFIGKSSNMYIDEDFIIEFYMNV